MPQPGLSAHIHRGSRQIGGSCVELAADGERLVLDLGLPLEAEPDEVALPQIEGLTAVGTPPLALILSHGHPDHYGLAGQANRSVPVYIGEAAHRILQEASFFTPGEYSLAPAGFLRDHEPIQLGPFTVTPFLVDHSAYDAYALLVDAGGRRLFYSGDFRAHGRKHRAMDRLIAHPPHDIDALLLEGTHVRALDDNHRAMTEAELETELVGLAKAKKGLLLLAYSPQNADRLVTAYRAAVRSGRDLVIDLYAAVIAEATDRDTIPKAGWDRVRVFVPQAQRIKVKRRGAFARTEAVKSHRIYPEQLADAAGRIVMTFRASMAPDLERADCLAGAQAIWSMWPGYLENDAGQRLTAWLAEQKIPLTMLHASGHATVEDLQRLAGALAARAVIPIHTAAPERFVEFFENVTPRRDGEWWSI
jgi:ribonuclease J